jgi:hypothetical protein
VVDSTGTNGTSSAGAGNGLFDGFDAYRTPTDADYRRVLTEGIVVPDTNVFLNLYRYNEKTRNDLFAVLRGLEDRLWVPHQVVVEFWRNREAVLRDPRDTSTTGEELSSQRDKAINTVKSWANRVGLGQEQTENLTQVLMAAFTKVIAEVADLADSNASDVARNTNNDPVLLKLEPIMRGRVGKAPNKQELAQALIDAKSRGESKIPPGYKDIGKDPLAAAGDYLVWIQTMEHAKAVRRDVLFVTGDVKEDWWRRSNGELRGPRVELVEELREHASVRLFMARTESLLLHARQALQVNVSDESVQDVERVDQLSASAVTNSLCTLEDLRAKWDEVLDVVRGKRKIVWMVLRDTTPSTFDADTLTLKFIREGDARAFHGSNMYPVLQEALGEVFSIYPKIVIVSPEGNIFERESLRRMMLAPGDTVTHDTYGIGIVTSTSGSPKDPEAEIDFGSEIGVKHLVLRYAPIAKI